MKRNTKIRASLLTACLKARYVLVALGFLSFICNYAMRLNLSIGIVAMVDHTAIGDSGDENKTTECRGTQGTNDTLKVGILS